MTTFADAKAICERNARRKGGSNPSEPSTLVWLVYNHTSIISRCDRYLIQSSGNDEAKSFDVWLTGRKTNYAQLLKANLPTEVEAKAFAVNHVNQGKLTL